MSRDENGIALRVVECVNVNAIQDPGMRFNRSTIVKKKCPQSYKSGLGMKVSGLNKSIYAMSLDECIITLAQHSIYRAVSQLKYF